VLSVLDIKLLVSSAISKGVGLLAARMEVGCPTLIVNGRFVALAVLDQILFNMKISGRLPQSLNNRVALKVYIG
jgi:hypothetical protein